MSNETTELKPCFCGRIPKIETRDVEPQEDRLFRGETITFVLCECGQCLFDGALHEGFVDEEDAATAWNYRVASEDNPEGAAAPELVEALRSALEKVGNCLKLHQKYKHVGDGHLDEAAEIIAALAKYRGEA